MMLKEAFNDITSHIEQDSHLSCRFLQKIAFSLQDQLFGPGKGTLVSRGSSLDDTNSMDTDEIPRKRGRPSDAPILRSPKSRRSTSFPHPFNKVQEAFAELFDLDETLDAHIFKSIPGDCV
jgi:hypothetical protein